jgi:hypothetical protein
MSTHDDRSVPEHPQRIHSPSYAAHHIERISTVLLVGFVAAVAVHYWLGHYQGLGYPGNTYLFRPGDEFGVPSGVTRLHAFSDLLAPYLHAAERDPYFTVIEGNLRRPWNFPSNYPPLATLLLWPFTALPYPLVAWLFLAASVAGLLAYGAISFAGPTPPATARNAIIFTILTYPAQLVLDRGNLEIVAFFLVALFAHEHRRGRDDRAAIFLGSAIALKLFPVVFLAVYLRPRRLRPILLTLGVSGALTLASFVALRRPLSENLPRFLEVLTKFSSNQVSEGILGARSNSSLSSMLEVVAALSSGELSQVANTLAALPLALGLGALFFWACLRLPLSKWAVFALAVATMTLLPRAAADYRLIHWLIPLAIFVREAEPTARNRIAGLLFALLLIPKGIVLVGEVRASTVLNPMLMLAIAGTAMVSTRSTEPPPRNTRGDSSTTNGAT